MIGQYRGSSESRDFSPGVPPETAISCCIAEIPRFVTLEPGWTTTLFALDPHELDRVGEELLVGLESFGHLRRRGASRHDAALNQLLPD